MVIKNKTITPLEIAIWEIYLQEQTAPLKELIIKKRKRQNALYEQDELNARTLNICKMLGREIRTLESALYAIESVKLAYIEHCIQLYSENRAKIAFLEHKWRSCWEIIGKLQETILSTPKCQCHDR